MKKLVFLLFLSLSFYSTAQQLALKKGVIIDGIKVNDSIAESFALYLPTSFDINKKWPVIFVLDTKGRAKQALSMYREAAEEKGYLLAASNNIQDTLSLSKNIMISSRMFNALYSFLPIHAQRSYTSGFSDGARLATLIPTFIKDIKGVISCGSPVANMEVLSSKNPFHFIGIVGTEDYNYSDMSRTKKVLDKFKFPNNLILFEGGHQWPAKHYLAKAFDILTLAAMNKKIIPNDSSFVEQTYQTHLGNISSLVTSNKPLLANNGLLDMANTFKGLKKVDSLLESAKTLRKTKLFRTYNRNQNAIEFKETLIKEDYVYFLEEDIASYNYNNLGWWKYQMDEISKYENSINIFQKQMGKRLRGYLNALVADNIDLVQAEPVVDDEALNLLWMLNTITDEKKYDSYLNIISQSARLEDYGTALFYLEELLKNGYTNQEELYTLEHTALFRIMPEFNKIVEKYLKEARYKVIEE